jgi:hypothetical protein
MPFDRGVPTFARLQKARDLPMIPLAFPIQSGYLFHVEPPGNGP